MGGKRKRPRQYILLFPAACLMLLVTAVGCRMAIERPAFPDHPGPGAKAPSEKTPSSTPDEPGDLPQPSVQPLEPSPTTHLARLETQFLDRAAILLQKGQTEEALASVGKALTCCEGRFSDRALQILADALARSNSAADRHGEAFACFPRLESAFPDAVYGPAAQCWAATLNALFVKDAQIQKLSHTIRIQKKRIEGLEKQIEQLKAVDLELESPKPSMGVP